MKKTDEHNFQRRVFVRFFCSYRINDNFYPWLKAHQGDFETDYNKMIDRSGLQKLNLCPAYNAFEEKMVLADIQYKDLYINLEPAKKYIGEYKGSALYTRKMI